jgi:peptidoglycan hydrolase-like protein with peptidoglycan-binding domain
MKPFLRIGAVVLVVAGTGMLAAWIFSGASPGKLAWDPPVVRKTLMSFAYKVYANPEVADGRYFLSKVVLKNTGAGPIRDLAVSYQVPDYIPWTTPEVTNALPAGNTLVQVFYPKFTDKVSRLANQTTATLEIRLQWREREGGPLKEEVLRDNFTLLGVNEVQYSDLPNEDIATWYDSWTLAQFTVCMVTPNDPVVKEYAAAITERTGGSMAGATRSPEDVIELMKATYEYMVTTGMRYAGAKGVPEKIGGESKLVQTVRLPRDVILSNNGLCIELAILWASIMDQLGCESYIVMLPGHAFTIVMAEGQMFPIECTAITPKAVGSEKFVPFAQAVKMAADEFQKQELKIPYSVRQLQVAGYASPELPDIDIEKIKNILAARNRSAARTPATTVAPQGQEQLALAAGLAQYVHPRGLISFGYPQNWQMGQPVPQIGNTFYAGDMNSKTSVQLYEVPNVSDPRVAMNLIAQAIGRRGARLSVTDSEAQGNVYFFQGNSAAPAGYFRWIGVFRAVPGGVIGITLGCPQANFEANRALFNQIFGTVNFQQ